uniref:Auxin efflux carrier component n=1 Tax=Araucaria cunninghamii TaxID=56994 RepID=A0A0D6R0Y2_ARACU
MASYVLSIGEEIAGNTQNLMSSVVPLLKLLCLTSIGLVLAHPKMRLIPKDTFKLLSKLVFALFLPCLIFTELGKSVTLDNMREWWFIPVNVMISTVVGCILGYLVALICRPPPQFFRFTVVMTGLGNTGNLPIAIIGSVCHSSDHPFGHNCNTTGVAYVSFAQWVAVILVYSFVYHMLEPPEEFYEIVPEGEIEMETEEITDANMPLLFEAEWPGIHHKETEHCKTPFIARIFRGMSGNSEVNSGDLVYHEEEGGAETGSPRSVRCLMEPKVVRRVRVVAERTPIQHILQPPTIASLLAIIVGMVPYLRSILFEEDAPLSFFTDSLQIMAAAMVPSVMLVLGGLLAEGPDKSELGMRTTIGIVFTRLVLLPIVGIGVVTLAGKLGLVVSGDKMFNFVLLLQYTTPSAILLGAMANLRGYGPKEASALLFWQHIFALFSLSLFVTVYFKLLNHV